MVKSPEELRAEAIEKSSRVKALYMTADVAQAKTGGGVWLRERIIELAENTEVNGVVIDVKEVCGPDYDEFGLRGFIQTLKDKNIWTIARIVVFKDASQVEAHPEWYLKREKEILVGNECWNKRYLQVSKSDPDPIGVGLTSAERPFWRDRRGGYWLDPASEGARNYILEISKKMIDIGFDELQFDYIRFASDGDVENAIYPAWDGKTPKYAALKSFFEFLNKNLKEYKPDIILSADLFGYAAIRAGDVGIGQRLEDIGDSFDYISFMVYPSHYYSGFFIPGDPGRDLPLENLSVSQVRMRPDAVVYRSLLFARDFLDGRLSTSSITGFYATTTLAVVENPIPRSKARLRPWLEDFFHEEDKANGRPYGVEKVRLQIEAAEKAEDHGWLLWNAANIYTEDALRKE